MCPSHEQRYSGRLSLSVSDTAALFWKFDSQCVSHTSSAFPEGCLSVSLTLAALFWKVVSQCVSHMNSVIPEGCLLVSHMGSIVLEGHLSVCLSHWQHFSGRSSLSVFLT